MELHQLRYFVAVVDEGSFTRAAARVHVSQSGVSAQVRRLERELGQPLLDRSSRQVRLTATGEAVLPLARAALDAVAAVGEVADEVAGLIRGRVRMGMVTGCSLPGLVDGLAQLHGAHPGLSVQLVEGSSDILQRQVVTGDLDLALVGYAEAPDDGLAATVIVDEPLVVAVAPDHRLGGRRRVRLTELDALTVIGLPVGTGIRTAFDRRCRSEGVDVRVELEASSPEMVASLAANGLGVGILSASMVATDPRLSAILLTPRTHARLGLVRRARAPVPPATAALLEAVTGGLTDPEAAMRT